MPYPLICEAGFKGFSYGFRHIARIARGRFWIQRVTDKKKMMAKPKQVKAEKMRRRHLPVAEQGRWLA